MESEHWLGLVAIILLVVGVILILVGHLHKSASATTKKSSLTIGYISLVTSVVLGGVAIYMRMRKDKKSSSSKSGASAARLAAAGLI